MQQNGSGSRHMGGSRGGSGHPGKGVFEAGALDVYAWSSKIGFYLADTVETAAGVDVNSSVRMIIGSHSQQALGVAGIGNRCIGVRAEKKCIIRNKASAGKPDMKGPSQIQRSGD